MTNEPRRYTILEPIGRGGFGVVYRAEQRGMDGFRKPVALKFLRPELEADAELAARFRDEARLLGLLSHGAFVRVDGMVRLAGQRAMVLEYVDGADLSMLLQLGTVPIRPALQIAAALAAALEHAHHRRGPDGRPLELLHRDIKPANLRITPAGELRVLDLGVAWARPELREGVTGIRRFGTAPYMAPERGLGLDTRAGDLYALGAVLFEMLVGDPPRGRPPRPGRPASRTPDQLWRALAELCAERCPALLPLMEELLEDEPERRPEVGAARDQLEAMARSLESPTLARWAERAVPLAQGARSPLEGDALTGQTLVEETLTTIAELPAPPPRSRGIALLLGLALPVLGGLSAWGLLRESPDLAARAEPATSAAPPPTSELAPELAPSPELERERTEQPPPSIEQAPALPVRGPARPREIREVEAPAPVELGVVEVMGDLPLDLSLESADSSASGRLAAGPVPPGTWRVRAQFHPDDPLASAGTVEVRAGQTTTITCSAALRRCR